MTQFKPKPTYILGLDLGQSADFTALTLLERHAPAPAPPDAPPNRPTYSLPALRRWPLGTSYVDIVADLARLPESCPELEGATLVVDRSGVGAAVADMLRQRRLPFLLRNVTITGGSAVTGGGADWNVAKLELVSALVVVLQSQRLKAAKDIPEWKTLKRELEGYRVKVTAAANETFNPRDDSAHDDLILAVALAAWWGETFGGAALPEVVQVPSRFPERAPFGRARARSPGDARERGIGGGRHRRRGDGWRLV
jgi:hypothetical protein